MTPLRLLTCCVALAAATGCSTSRETTLFELKADGAMEQGSKRGHCTEPFAELQFAPDDGVRLSLTESERGNQAMRVTLDLAVSRSFAFVTPAAQVTTGPGKAPVAVPLSPFWHMPYPSLVMARNAPDAVMEGPAPNTLLSPQLPQKVLKPTDHAVRFHYEGGLNVHGAVGTPSPMTLRLPDALVNGRRVTFPPIEMTQRAVRYMDDGCYR